MNKIFSVAKNFFLNLLYPEHIKCIVCQLELSKQSKFDLCDNCLNTLPYNNQRQCEKCGTHLSGINAVCNNCMKTEFYFDKAISALIYEKPIKNLVYQLKFGNKKYLSKPLSQFLVDKYLKSDIEVDIVVCVPSSKKSFKKRGYNQSYLLAKGFCDTIDKVFNYTDLVKIKETPTQEGLTRAERANNLAGSFKVLSTEPFKGKRILLIDDVKTTGCTASECAKVLKRCNAKSVYVLTLASVREYIPFE